MKAVEEKDEAQPTVAFCDRCSTVCDDRCRADAVVSAARDRVVALGFRL